MLRIKSAIVATAALAPLLGWATHAAIGSPAPVNAPVAAANPPGYTYSPAMKGSRKRWDRANLANPKGLGTKMMTPGVSDAKKRKELVDHLMALN